MPENIEKTNLFLDLLKPLAETKNASISQLVIRWTISQPGITCALVGSRNATQAEDNAKAVHVKLTKDEIEEINAHLYALRF